MLPNSGCRPSSMVILHFGATTSSTTTSCSFSWFTLMNRQSAGSDLRPASMSTTASEGKICGLTAVIFAANKTWNPAAQNPPVSQVLPRLLRSGLLLHGVGLGPELLKSTLFTFSFFFRNSSAVVLCGRLGWLLFRTLDVSHGIIYVSSAASTDQNSRSGLTDLACYKPMIMDLSFIVCVFVIANGVDYQT